MALSECFVDLLAHDTGVWTGTPVIVGDDPLADLDDATYADITTTTGRSDAINSIFDILPADAVAAGVLGATFNMITTSVGSKATPLLMHADNSYFVAMHPFGSYLPIPNGTSVLTQFEVTPAHLAMEGLTPADLTAVLLEPARLVVIGLVDDPGPVFRLHRAWLSVYFNCAVVAEPVRRLWPRSDGRGLSNAARIWPPPSSIYDSNRIVGGYPDE